MQYICMLVQGANNKKNNRELCNASVQQKQNGGMHYNNGFEVYNLWYAYVTGGALMIDSSIL